MNAAFKKSLPYIFILSGVLFAPFFMANAGGQGRVYSFTDIAKFFIIINVTIIIVGMPLVGREKRQENKNDGVLSEIFEFTNKIYYFAFMMAGLLAGSVFFLPILKFNEALLVIPFSILTACIVLILFSKR